MGVRAERSDRKETMRLLLLSLIVTLVASQSSDRLEPPPGQKCSGRNYNGRRCCTPEQPCGLGEGDCDGPLDGGTHDGDQGCRGNLRCGSNNCKKFGAYFHEKDDCDGPGDGGLNDGHAGCKGDLVCGSNNCRKFGAYYHEKDDCCERATSPLQSSKSPEFDRNEKQGWGPWSSWGPCSHTCGAGRKTRQRQCLGKCKNHHLFENQERICVNPDCNFL